uniref:Pseudouridine synthase n=1 Tax=Paulinella chromatophora TaxID=39717 RepID=B1X4C1_PAUCH|nr:Pseudouridine synthase, RluD [Paulinella chromatophora]ACB42790.1 Pseudouridine synthase, RluD [Paulinella chromatophora]
MNNYIYKKGEILKLCYSDLVPMRLDRWLALKRPEQSRSRIQKFIYAGLVRVNGIKSSTKTPLRQGDQVQIWMPPPDLLPYLIPQHIPLDILFEDQYLIVVNKPADLTVHPAPGNKYGTLVNGLLFHCSDLMGIGGEMRPGVVHRLDKSTTGCIVIAKTKEILAALQLQIQNRVVSREYIGIVHGVPATNKGTIIGKLGRHPVNRKRYAVLVNEKGRYACTHWCLIERWGDYSLLRFKLDTGRTHQIRIHCSHIGYPIIGDQYYSKQRRLPLAFNGQALHAVELSFNHPVNSDRMVFHAPLPKIFEKLLTSFRSFC